MPKSLLEQLPDIVANGRRQAERILESLESRQRVRLHTREVVLPARDSAAHDWITQHQRVALSGAAHPPPGLAGPTGSFMATTCWQPPPCSPATT